MKATITATGLTKDEALEHFEARRSELLHTENAVWLEEITISPNVDGYTIEQAYEIIG